MSENGPYKSTERHQTYWSSDGKNYRRRRHAAYIWPIILALLIVLTTLVLVFIFYSYDDKPSGEKTTPLIEASHTLIKQKPSNPGGEEVPHQDKLIFSTIDSVEPLSSLGAEYQAEIIRKAPEVPIDVELVENEEGCEEKSEKKEILADTTSSNTLPEEKKDAASSTDAKKNTPNQASEKTSAITETEPEKEKAAKKEPTKEESFTYTIQTSAMYTKKLAEEEWALQQKDSSLLTSKTPYAICHEETTGHDSLHKLYVGLYKTKEQAQTFCNQLKKDRVNCFVVKKPQDQKTCSKEF